MGSVVPEERSGSRGLEAIERNRVKLLGLFLGTMTSLIRVTRVPMHQGSVLRKPLRGLLSSMIDSPERVTRQACHMCLYDRHSLATNVAWQGPHSRARRPYKFPTC